MTKTALVTGAAGFIGYHVCNLLLSEGWRVYGVDKLSDYYDVRLKTNRLRQLEAYDRSLFDFSSGDLSRGSVAANAVCDVKPDLVVHLAAQAGVRHSIDHPEDYITDNVVATMKLMQACAEYRPAHAMIASTSSVYGSNNLGAHSENHRTQKPMSFYAASKLSAEAIAHSYSHLYDIPTTVLRFFTVYGPWGRPDMALHKFVKAIKAGEPIDVYNYGEMHRDFTYIDDLVEALYGIAHIAPIKGQRLNMLDSLSNSAPYRTVNIGFGTPFKLMALVHSIESILGVTAEKNMLPMQPGDIQGTESDNSLLHRLVPGIEPTPLPVGVKRFIQWYEHYYEDKAK